MVKRNQISFIVQGYIVPEQDTPFGGTKGALKQIRNLFPDAQIILSVWEGINVDGLDYDDLVVQEDPHVHENRIHPCNLNRQLLGVQGALGVAKRDYLIKTRSDLFIPDDSFFQLYNHQAKNMKAKYFKEPVLLTKYSTKKFVKFNSVALHYSDWFHFGCREDVSSLWSAPLTEEPEFQNYLKGKGFPGDTKFAPEQYFWVWAMRNHLPKSFEHMFSFDKDIYEFEKDLIKNDLIYWDNDIHGLEISRYNHLSQRFRAALYDELDYSLLKENKDFLYALRRFWKKYTRLRNIF